MGVVWAATHLLTEKACALKFLKGSRATEARNHARLLNEARATCRVRHPNVAQVYDILELPSGVPFIVMDLLEGEPLSARLARAGSLDLDRALEIVLSVVDTISAAHALGVVHRDLKPDNVFLERGPKGVEVVKVLDFGIAKRFDVVVPTEASQPRLTPRLEEHALTTTYSAVGTPSYMAPEQLQAAGPVGVEVDVWALDLIAYECLTGQRPARDPATSEWTSPRRGRC
jgi:serine/threonine-protein kinase